MGECKDLSEFDKIVMARWLAAKMQKPDCGVFLRVVSLYQKLSKEETVTSNWASVGSTGQTSVIHGGPSSQLTRLQGSVANISVPDITAHLQGSSGIHASGVFWQQKRDQHKIRQSHNVTSDRWMTLLYLSCHIQHQTGFCTGLCHCVRRHDLWLWS